MLPKALTAGVVSALAVTVALAAPADSTQAPRPARASAPNVLLVVMDDMRADDMAWMPRVQRRVVDAGTSYRSFYAPTSLCCPSRFSILRGQYPHNTGILTNAEPDGGFVASRGVDQSTLATWLDPTYATGFVGKYLNGYRGADAAYVPPGWDDWMATINPFNYLNIFSSDNGVVVDHSGPNSPGVFARQAERFVTERSGRAEPFFLHLSIVNPHNGRPHRDGGGAVGTPYVPRGDRGTYAGPPHAQNPSFNERDVSDKAGPAASYPRLSADDKAVIEIKNQQRRESLASADRAIARVIRSIEAAGELSNTYLIFTSDNGYVLGEHRIADGKRSPYEPASNLPLVIAGPGVPVGHEWTAAAGTQDIAPTILDIAGAQPGYPLDGHSVLPSADRLDDDPQRAVLLEGARRPVDAENGGKIRYARDISVANTDWLYRAVVTRRWKLIHWDQTDTFELYNLRRDPYEVDSLYGRSRYVQRAAELRARLRLLRMCQAGTCEN